MTKTRTETDTFGPIEVAGRPLLGRAGAALARQLQDRLGEAAACRSCARSGIVKRAAAEANMALGRLDPKIGEAIVARRAGGDRRQARRPLPAGRLADRLRHAVEHERQRGDLEPGHRDAGRRDGLQEAGAPQRPRQHEPVVERHLSDGHAHRLRRGDRPPACCRRCSTCTRRSTPRRKAFAHIIKIGRTHTQDATPLTLGQEFSRLRARRSRMAIARHRVDAARALCSWRRAAPPSAPASTRRWASPRRSPRGSPTITGLPFITAPNKFEALAAHDAMVFSHGALNTVAAALFKIANDIRFLGSRPALGPRRAGAAGERAGLLDHAGQGQPDPVRGADPGLRAGVRQPRRASPSPAARATSSSTSSTR